MLNDFSVSGCAKYGSTSTLHAAMPHSIESPGVHAGASARAGQSGGGLAASSTRLASGGTTLDPSKPGCAPPASFADPTSSDLARSSTRPPHALAAATTWLSVAHSVPNRSILRADIFESKASATRVPTMDQRPSRD